MKRYKYVVIQFFHIMDIPGLVHKENPHTCLQVIHKVFDPFLGPKREFLQYLLRKRNVDVTGLLVKIDKHIVLVNEMVWKDTPVSLEKFEFVSRNLHITNISCFQTYLP